ncbi:patatin-like phospholipase family protein [Lihuaxuella thermophila]|uniref:NTE family protein n=1 Tax=Lihuaxuella thermophila TaxID=1173111 RepID=A0A1H8EWH0_9BACL|nr:patatin-like phospholipase family protein [Lihuaxuella thermophila]SEN23822.1 NTE family protein [Lihuaxuella thermophila]
MWADAVFEGGGVKGIGLVGALCVAEEKGFKWRKLAGTSAGSIVASLLAAGYTAKELYQIMIEQDFVDFILPSWYDQLPYLGPTIRLWIKKGMFSGLPLERWIEKLLLAKGIRTFGDLKGDRELHIIASDISRGRLLVLPHDLEQYGYNPKELSVARIVRMSCSIPFFFEPVKIIHKPTGSVCYVVDGAVLSNFPVWLFDQDNPRWPTLGFRLTENQAEHVHKIYGPLSMFRSILFTMMDAHDNRHIQEQDQVRTIMVPTLDVKMTDFSISREKKEQLFQSGVKAAEQFFKTWNFDHYLAVRGVKRQVTYQIRPSTEKR